MKLKLLTAALVLATSGSAHALIIDGASNNGELFMTLWDPVDEISYTLDLNLTMNDFLAGAATGLAWNWPADANMTAFLGLAGGTSDLLYAIGAIDTNGATATDYYRFISTASVIDLNNTVTNGDLKKLGTNGNQFLGNTNGLIGTADSLIVTDKSIPAYAGSALWGSNWGNAFNGTSTAKVGDSVGLYLLRQTDGRTLANPALNPATKPSVYEALSFNGNAYQARLDGAGNLNISPVPEPEAYALMLAGLGLVGWMARRRQG
jgi:hypothetical protein